VGGGVVERAPEEGWNGPQKEETSHTLSRPSVCSYSARVSRLGKDWGGIKTLLTFIAPEKHDTETNLERPCRGVRRKKGTDCST